MKRFYIWSLREQGWLVQGGSGYTSDITMAGVFDGVEVLDLAHPEKVGETGHIVLTKFFN